MLYTSNEANKLLRQYKEDLDSLFLKESRSCKYVASIDEDPKNNKPYYDLETTHLTILAMQKDIRTIKHAINVFNTTTPVGNTGMTIDEVLVALPQWNYRLRALKNMINVLPKTRLSSSKFIEYEYANYDIEEAKVEYNALLARVMDTQKALDSVNNTIKFEIDI